eukprot:2043558-Pleurochrysis_carterae.AAC.1
MFACSRVRAWAAWAACACACVRVLARASLAPALAPRPVRASRPPSPPRASASERRAARASDSAPRGRRGCGRV